MVLFKKILKISLTRLLDGVGNHCFIFFSSLQNIVQIDVIKCAQCLFKMATLYSCGICYCNFVDMALSWLFFEQQVLKLSIFEVKLMTVIFKDCSSI